ncbi:MAG: Stp1/IreP family PP2C-type Ser/Thr phosphatase [Clostridia bacterium]|nr:Stp1/IreP family PP2C-type Ser/Thr phosphatase [Clostridia bacterium]
MRIGAATDIGIKRKINEDAFFVYQDSLFLIGFVADGMGGHQAGEVASKMAADFIYGYITKELSEGMNYVEAAEAARRAFVEANNEIYIYAKKHEILLGMGATSTLAMVYQGKLITAHVGDSRVYTIGSEIKRVTKDHSYVQELLLRGEISEELAKNHPKKNYIMRAMGTEDTIKVDVGIYNYNDEIVLVCSDGLTNMVEEEEIKDIILENDNLQTAAERLVEKANSMGGTDNITVVLFDK